MSLWQASTPLRTHNRAMASFLDTTRRRGHASTRIADRVVAGFHLPTLWNTPPRETEATYRQRLRRLRERHQPGMQHLCLFSIDSAARAPGIAPWALYPWLARYRAEVICDYLLVAWYMSLDQIAAEFRRRGQPAQIRLRSDQGPLDKDVEVLLLPDSSPSLFGITHRLILHGHALQQLIFEGIDTSCFVDAHLEALHRPNRSTMEHSFMVFSNERANWR